MSDATVNSITMGGTSGTQIFSQGGNTLTVNSTSFFGPNAVYNFSGGDAWRHGDLTITGPLKHHRQHTFFTGTGLLTTSGATTVNMPGTVNEGVYLSKNWVNTGTLTVGGDDLISLMERHPDQRQRWNAEPEQHLCLSAF